MLKFYFAGIISIRSTDKKREDPDPDPEPYLLLMDLDSGGPQTCGSAGSPSPSVFRALILLYGRCRIETMENDSTMTKDKAVFHLFICMQGGNPDIDNVDDLLEFRKTHESFRLLGFSETDTNNIYRLKYCWVISCRTVRFSFVEEDTMLFWIRAMDYLTM